MNARRGTRGRTTAVTVTVVVSLASVLGACSKDDGSERSFCAAVKSAPTMESVVVDFTKEDPAALARRLDRASAAYETVRKSAPDAVRKDVAVLIDVVDEVIAAIRAHPDDQAAALAQVEKAMASHPEAAQASTRVSGYAKTNCDIDLNPGVGPAPSTQTPTTGG